MITIFSLLFFIFPLSYGLTKIKYVLLIIILLYVFIRFIFSKSSFKSIKINPKYYPIILFCITLLSRIIISLMLYKRIIQVSDFQRVHSAMETLNFTNKFYQNFVHWLFYPLIYNFILKFFTINQLSILLLNSVVLSIITVLIYRLALIILKNKKYALIASSLYIIWPANAFYVVIMTPEHLSQLFLLSGIILVLNIINNHNENKKFKFFVYALLTGVFLGISTFFKDFALVVTIALFIYLIFLTLRSNFRKKILIKYILLFINIIVAFILTKNIMYLASDNIVGTKVNRNIAPCYLLVGLHSSGNGAYDANLYNTYFDLLDKNKDYKKTNKQVKKILIEDIKNNKNFPTHLHNKARKLMINDNERINWVIESANKNKDYNLTFFLSKYIIPLNNLYYLLILILMFFALLQMNIKKNFEVLFMFLIIFGSSFLIILIEVQSRYLYALFPFFCITASYGLYFLYNFICGDRKIMFGGKK